MKNIFFNVENLYFRYNKKEKNIIDNMNFSLEKGVLSGLIGNNGCGKSTLLRLIVGLQEPSAGNIYLENQKLTGKKSICTEKRNIGIVFQDYVLFPHMTVKKNILFGLTNSQFSKKERIMRLEKILDLIDMKDFVDYFPHMLSGGQCQRVALGRSLAPYPRMLLLDEPFSNLDISVRSNIRREVRNLIKKLNITTLIVTHQQQDLDIVDSTLNFINGKVFASRTTNMDK